MQFESQNENGGGNAFWIFSTSPLYDYTRELYISSGTNNELASGLVDRMVAPVIPGVHNETRVIDRTALDLTDRLNEWPCSRDALLAV